MSSASSRCPSSGLAFPPAGPPILAPSVTASNHRFTTTEGSFVRPQPTPRVRYASRVPLYDEANDEEDDDDDWTRLYGLGATDGGTISAATGRRLSPIRAFGQNHRRTASLDNIIDGIGEPTVTNDSRSRRSRLRVQPSDRQADAIIPKCSRPPCWSPHRFMGSTKSISSPIEDKMSSKTMDDGTASSGLKTKLKSISDKYLKNPVAGMVMNGRDTLTGSILNRIRNKHQSHIKDGHVHCEQDSTNRSSFRSFSCSTLPALDDFQRKRLMAASSVGANTSSSSELVDDIDSPGSPIVLRGEGDSDSGIVPEWSDTSSISESSYIRHFQPCQMLSSWRKPQPKVRRSLSPIFQYRALQANTSVDQVDSSINTSTTSSSAAYETLWPTEDAEPTVPEHHSILSSDTSAVHLDEVDGSPVAPARTSSPTPPDDDEAPPCDVRRVHTTRIHIEYPSPTEPQVKVTTVESSSTPRLAVKPTIPSRPHYQTASLDRRALSKGSKPLASDRGGASVHLIKIERDQENLKAELGIFIAKKKLTRGSVGYLVAHIVPGGLVDR